MKLPEIGIEREGGREGGRRKRGRESGRKRGRERRKQDERDAHLTNTQGKQDFEIFKKGLPGLPTAVSISTQHCHDLPLARIRLLLPLDTRIAHSLRLWKAFLVLFDSDHHFYFCCR